MLLVPKATILYDIKKDSAVKDKKEIVCRNGHRYRKPFTPHLHGRGCIECRREANRRSDRKASARYLRYKRDLKHRIAYKKERINQIEQEISGRNGGIQDYQDY